MHEDHVVVVCPKLKNLLCAFHEVSTEVWLKVHTRYEKSPFCGLSTNPSWLKYSDIQISWQTMPPKITKNWHLPGISEDQMDKRETGDSQVSVQTTSRFIYCTTNCPLQSLGMSWFAWRKSRHLVSKKKQTNKQTKQGIFYNQNIKIICEFLVWYGSCLFTFKMINRDSSAIDLDYRIILFE